MLAKQKNGRAVSFDSQKAFENLSPCSQPVDISTWKCLHVAHLHVHGDMEVRSGYLQGRSMAGAWQEHDLIFKSLGVVF